MRTTKLVLALILGSLCGCATPPDTPPPGGGPTGSYRGPDEWQEFLFDETHRQHVYTGGDLADASQLVIFAYRCAPPAGDNDDGPWSCDPSCTKVSGCVHAWNLSRPGSWQTEYLFVTYPGGMFPEPIGRHEILHFIGRNSPEVNDPSHPDYDPSGHPEFLTINGKRYRARDIILDARWPARVANTLTLRLFADDPWINRDFECGYVEIYLLRDSEKPDRVQIMRIPEQEAQ